MTETKNYGFQKPDPADLVDVGAINRNFDKVDEELARKTIPIVLDQEIDLTQDFNSINVTEQIAAVADRFVSDLKRGIPVSVSLIHQDKPFVFLLTDWFQSREDYFVVWGTFSNPHDVTKISSFILYAFLGHGSDLEYHAGIGGSGGGSLPADFPVSVDENGYTQIEGLPRATNVDSVQDGNTVNMTITMQDGSVINGVLVLNDSGEPVSYTEDGITCTFTHTVVTEEGG